MKDTRFWTAVSQNEWEAAESDGDVLSDKASQLMFMAGLIEPTTKFPMYNVSTRVGPDGFGQNLVSLFMSGKERFIGYKIADPEIACRFADMATLRFRKYIRRVKWNFSEAQAIADTANNEQDGGELARMLLDRRANTWKLAGIILKEVPKAASVKVKSNRRTVESRLASLESRLAALESNRVTVAVPPIHTTDPLPQAPPIFYPTVTCTGPTPIPITVKTPDTIWKAQ